MTEKTKMPDRLFHKINEFHASLKDGQAKAQFRKDYRALIESKFSLPPASPPTNQTRLIDQMLDHARNLKEAEETRENLSRELGDF